MNTGEFSVAVAPGTLARDEFDALVRDVPQFHPARMPEWGEIVGRGMRQQPWVVTVRETGSQRLVGVLPLIFMRSALFGRHLISAPYLNVGGAFVPGETCLPGETYHSGETCLPGDSERRGEVESLLVDEAVRLADALDVNYLELRNERESTHPALNHARRDKALMRLPLPDSVEALWDGLRAKVRNQVRKGQNAGLTASWGGRELVPDFYRVFAATMRNVGTPVYSRRMFDAMLDRLPDSAEICVVRLPNGRVTGSAILLHGRGITEVPSAGTLRFANVHCANMFLYWNLLQHTVETRHSAVFDFGRSSVGCPTWRFKRQWGAGEVPVVWQYYVRRGSMDDVRPDNAAYGLAIRVWKRLPVWVTRLLGPLIVRGIP